MPSHDPSRARRPRKRRQCSSAQQPSDEGRVATEAEKQQKIRVSDLHMQVDGCESFDNLMGTLDRARRASVEDWATILMSGDYKPYLEAEDAMFSGFHAKVSDSLQPSSYRSRKNILSEEREAQYDERVAARQRDSVAHLQRSVNQRAWTLRVLARSVSYFNRRVPHHVWRQECSGGRLADPKTVKRLLTACAAAFDPGFELHRSVAVFGADQTFAWEGMNKNAKHHRGVERTDANGMPIRVENHVYVNCVQLLIPHSFPRLTAGEMLLIARHGPYTEPFDNILAPLAPARTQQELRDCSNEVVSEIRKQLPAGTPASDITLKQIADGTFGRPDTDPAGATPVQITPPCLKKDTKSYDDIMGIFAHLVRFLASTFSGILSTLIVLVLFGDGQLVLRTRDLKRKFPRRYKILLIGCGFFHHLAHLMFSLNQMFWLCFLKACAGHLGREKVYHRMKNLEHDNWKHVCTFFQVVTVAVTAYITQDVTDPPPELFLADPEAYAARVNHAGGIVMLHFLKYVGYPLSVWQRAQRAGDGERVCRLLPYSFHIFRSVAHKVQSVQIVLITLVGLYCAHPKLQFLLMASCSLSVLGRKGRNMFFDRFLEYVHLLQQKRMNSFTGFDTGLHFSNLLKPMIHIDHAWQAHAPRPHPRPCLYGRAAHAHAQPTLCAPRVHVQAAINAGREPHEEVMTLSMLIEARKLQDWFVTMSGTDLTQDQDENPYWHTGNPTRLDGGDYRERMPWLWVWRTAFGRVAGCCRAYPKAWNTFVHSFLQTGLWSRAV